MRKVLKKRMTGLAVLLSLVLSFAVLPANAAGETVTVDMASYTAAYRASNGSDVLQRADGYTVINDGDWAEYTVAIPKAGQYSVSLRELNNGLHTPVYSIAVNGTEQLTEKSGTVSVTFADSDLGAVNFDSGGRYTLRLSKISGYWSYIDRLTLTCIGEPNYNIRLNVRSYTNAYSAKDGQTELATDGAPDNTVWFIGDWAEYTINIVKPGRYEVGLRTAANVVDGVGEVLVYSFAVDGTDKLSRISKNVMNTTPYGEKTDAAFGHLVFVRSGTYKLKILKNNGGFSYADSVFLNFLNEVQKHEVRSDTKTTVLAYQYSRGYDVSQDSSLMVVENGLVSFGLRDYIEYVLEVHEAGLYSITAETASGSAVPIGTYDILVNDAVQYRQSFESTGWLSFASRENYIRLAQGTNILRFANSGKADMYVKGCSILRIGSTVTASGTDTSVTPYLTDDFSEVKNASARIAFAMCAPQSGIYKISVKAEAFLSGDINIYTGETLRSVIYAEPLERTGEYNSFIRLEAGTYTMKLKLLNGSFRFEDITVAYICGESAEAFQSVLQNAENAVDEAELKCLFKENTGLIGADIDVLTQDIQFENYVYARLLGKTYASDTDFLEALYNAIGRERIRPTLAAKAANGTLTVHAQTDSFTCDGTLLAAVYQNRRLIGMNMADFVRGDAVKLEVAGYSDACEWKVFGISDKKILRPIVRRNAVQEDIYVSADAADGGDGTQAHPYATISRAKARVAALTSHMTGDIVVHIMPGCYELSEPEIFTKENGGHGDYRVIYKGEDASNPPVISGGRKVSGWQHEGNGIYSATFTGKSVRNLYVNGYPAQRARSSRKYKMTSFSGTTMRATLDDTVLFAKPSDLVLVWLNEWAAHYTPVQNLTRQGTEAVFSMSEEFAWTTGVIYTDIGNFNSSPCTNQFYIENALELLDEPGEFYYDSQTQKIYYMPYSEENLSEVYASQLDEMVRVSGTSEADKATNMVFENLDFRYGAWNHNAVKQIQADQYIGSQTMTDGVRQQEYALLPAQFNINFADSIEVTDCRFSCLGSTAVAMREAVTNANIRGNLFRDLGGGAVSVGSFLHDCETGEGNACADIAVTDNVMRRTSLTYYGVPAVTVYYEKNVAIERNDIADIPYTGISVGWGWGTADARSGHFQISENRIANVMATLSDGAHIYTLGDLGGTVISRNYMYQTGDGRGGVYNDTGSGNVDILDNVIDVYMEKPSYWWVLGMAKTYNIHAEGNYAHSRNGIYESSGTNITHIHNTDIASDGSWDGLGNEAAQTIIDGAGVGLQMKDLLTKAELPAWRKNPLLVP